MSSVDYVSHNPRPGEIARAVFDAWRGITRAQVKGAFLFGCAVFAYHFMVFSNWIFTRAEQPIIAMGKGFFREQLGAFMLMLVLVATDRITGGDSRRRGAYAVAVVVSATLYALLKLLGEVGPTFVWIEFVKMALYLFFDWLVLAGVATFVYTDRRRARAAQARMRAAEIERSHAAKRTLESQLQALQARVEPQFLFNTLAQVRKLYAIDSATGERMLDELIAYLRAAMPKMRDTSSTLGQEIELARAYLAIMKVRLGDSFEYEMEAPADAADARMPPMMLLPLVDRAIARGLAEPGSAGSIRIRMTIEARKMRIEIVAKGVGLVPSDDDADIAALRDRLSALYGSDAMLVLSAQEPAASAAVLDLPCEPVEGVVPQVA